MSTPTNEELERRVRDGLDASAGPDGLSGVARAALTELAARLRRAEARLAAMCDCDAGVPERRHDPECAALQSEDRR